MYAFVLQIVRTYSPDSTGIIYCMTKKETEQMADFLRDNGVSVRACVLRGGEGGGGDV